MIVTAIVTLIIVLVTALPVIAQQPLPLETQEALLGPTADAIRTEIAATTAAMPLNEVAFDDTLLVGFLCAIGSMVFVLGLIVFALWLSARMKQTP
ncbi:MAG: hypothetical protein CL607_05400 [Anaerolineaceae bacterium]|nr:hypothetical protein [Anaerolineaceae bacterium]